EVKEAVLSALRHRLVDHKGGEQRTDIRDFLREVVRPLFAYHGDHVDNNNNNDVDVDKKKKRLKKKKSGLTKKDRTFARDWNAEYQEILEKGLTNLQLPALKRLCSLANDFVNCAETYAKVIVNELNVADECKTIKPSNVGGM